MRRLFTLPSLLLAAACGGAHDRPRDSAAAGRVTVPAVGPVSATTLAPPVSAPLTSVTMGDEPMDPRFADPDSALRYLLDEMLYYPAGGPRTSFSDCPDDMGVEHEPIEVAAVYLRPIRRAKDEVDSASYASPLRVVTYLVESRSVALLDTQYGGPEYRAIVAPRTDTLKITLEQWIRPAGATPTNWMECSAMLAADEAHDVWGFLHAGHPPDIGNARLVWSPAGSTWATVDALARKATIVTREK